MIFSSTNVRPQTWLLKCSKEIYNRGITVSLRPICKTRTQTIFHSCNNERGDHIKLFSLQPLANINNRPTPSLSWLRHDWFQSSFFTPLFRQLIESGWDCLFHSSIPTWETATARTESFRAVWLIAQKITFIVAETFFEGDRSISVLVQNCCRSFRSHTFVHFFGIVHKWCHVLREREIVLDDIRYNKAETELPHPFSAVSCMFEVISWLLKPMQLLWKHYAYWTMYVSTVREEKSSFFVRIHIWAFFAFDEKFKEREKTELWNISDVPSTTETNLSFKWDEISRRDLLTRQI